MIARSAALGHSSHVQRPFSTFAKSHQLGALRRSDLANRFDRRLPKERAFSTGRTSKISESPLRVSQLLGALLIFGIGATSWGLYEFYTTFTMWPNELRGDLRAGLKAKQRGDTRLARKHLARAWETLKSMSPESLSPDPYLKFSGIAIVLAEVLEAEQDVDAAFSVLKAALVAFMNSRNQGQSDSFNLRPNSPDPPSDSSTSTSTWLPRSPPRLSLKYLLDSRSYTVKTQLDSKARMRAIALALKLGNLAETLGRPEEEERWLGFAVSEVLRLVRDEYGLTHDSRGGFQSVSSPATASNAKIGLIDTRDKSAVDERHSRHGSEHDASVRDILSPNANEDDLGLPAWVSLTKSELAAPMERLGAFYARQGKHGPAILLYRVASQLLVQPKPILTNSNKRTTASPPSIIELCQALQIENAHMALMMDLRRTRPEDTAVLRDLPRVLTRAVNIYDEAVRRHGHGTPRDDSVAADSEISLCDETYPAVLYNAGVYYEEEGQLEQALRSYTLSYRALRMHGPREMMYEALENARRLQRLIDKNTKQASETPAQNGASSTVDKSLASPGQ